jgi:hypothetical protein
LPIARLLDMSFERGATSPARRRAMSTNLILIAVSVVFIVICVVLQIVLIVQGFKVSVKWGFINLLVPFGSLVFAFAKSGRRALAVVFLVSIVIGSACGVPGFYRLAKAFMTSPESGEEMGKKGFKEFDDQTQNLDNLNDLKL